MSKKKSYMDNCGILSENFLKKLRDKIANKLAVRNIKKDKSVKKDIDNLNQDLKDLWDDFNKAASKADSDHKPFKPKKLSIDDFIG
tara:strand:+ start:1004 stop:1261 length:258 start_codon:yes stop_codon:yes gene_type:complete